MCEINKVYVIPANKRAELKSKFADLNKKAAKVGCEAISFSFAHDHWCFEIQNKVSLQTKWIAALEELQDGWKSTGLQREYLALTVNGSAPKFADWSLLGVLSPMAVDGGVENEVRAIPGQSIPAEYRSRVGQCDHCHVNRQRNETYVVRHENGDHRMVGSACLKDFLGHQDPHAIAAFAELWLAIDVLARSGDYDDAYEGGGGRTEYAWDLQRFLEVTTGVIRVNGWLSRGAAYEQGRYDSTATQVIDLLVPVRGAAAQRAQDAEMAKIASGIDEAKALAAIEWAKSLNTTFEVLPDYLYNVNLIARAGYVRIKSAGVAASIIVAYNRHVEEETKRNRAKSLKNDWFGEIKSRVELNVTVNRIITIDGAYGTCGIHKMVTDDGYRVDWVATSAEWLDEGESYRIKATIVKHDEYKGVKCTKVNRVKVVKPIEAV